MANQEADQRSGKHHQDHGETLAGRRYKQAHFRHRSNKICGLPLVTNPAEFPMGDPVDELLKSFEEQIREPSFYKDGDTWPALDKLESEVTEVDIARVRAWLKDITAGINKES